MDRICWGEKTITFRDLIDNPKIKKPTLVRIGTKSFIVGEKIHGKFLVASLCKVSNNRNTILKRDIILSRQHNGIWKIMSKCRSGKESHIHRLTTKDIETIFRKDWNAERVKPRTFICTKDIEAFELHISQNDSRIANGQRVDRRKKYISEDVEFEVTDIGEVEYTPTVAERTSQDFVTIPKAKSEAIIQFFLPNKNEPESLIRNRTLRVIHCATISEARRRHFLLEVNEQPCDIRPIASRGSTELRYLQSTQNLFDYLLHYGNDTVLFVKLLRGDLPIKSTATDGLLVFKRILNGDQIPLCRVDDLEMSLVPPDLSVRVKLPTTNSKWHSLPEIRAAEVQCMQLSLALLARHESEMYVSTNFDKTYFDHDEEKSTSSPTPVNTRIKPIQTEKTSTIEEKILSKQSTRRPTKVLHSPSIKTDRNSSKRTVQKTDSTRVEQSEKLH